MAFLDALKKKVYVHNQSLSEFRVKHKMFALDQFRRVILVPHYQVIIKDLIYNISERMKINAPRGSMDEGAIIILDRYKVKLPASSFDQKTYLAGFQSLIENMFPSDLTFDGTDAESSDIRMLVTNFKIQVQIAASTNRASRFKFVRCHPLLQGSSQRFIYPSATLLHFEYLDSQSNFCWVQYHNFVEKKRTIDILGDINGSKDFEEIYKWGGRTYMNNAKEELEYIGNGYKHINGLQGVRDTAVDEERVEHDLAQLFPTVLTELYEFCAHQCISLDFLQ